MHHGSDGFLDHQVALLPTALALHIPPGGATCQAHVMTHAVQSAALTQLNDSSFYISSEAAIHYISSLHTSQLHA